MKMTKLKIFIVTGMMCVIGVSHAQTPSPQYFMVDSLPLCGADEPFVTEKWGVPSKVAYGDKDLSTLGGGVNSSQLTSTVFYYPYVKVSFYTYETSQWINMVQVTGGGVMVHVGEGLDFMVGDDIHAVISKMQRYLTPRMGRQINKGNYNLTFKFPSTRPADCPMTGFVYFLTDDKGIVTEIKIGMVKNG